MSGHLELVYSLSMPTCSSCGKAMNNLYNDHADLTKKLTKAIESNEVELTTFYARDSEKDCTQFIRTFYKWKRKNDEENNIAKIYQPSVVVAHALLKFNDSPLTEDELPFGCGRREVDGQRSVFNVSLCCLRQLLCKPDLHLRVESS